MVNIVSSSSRLGKSIRWLGRGFSILIILFWGFFFVMHLFGGEEPNSRPLNERDYIQLFLSAVWFIGLALSWKWELIGGVVVITSFIVFGFVNLVAFKLPFPIIPATAFLFILSWWFNRPKQTIH